MFKKAQKKKNGIIIKTPEQIEGIRKSCHLAARILDTIEPHVTAGVTTEYLNGLIHKLMEESNAKPATLNYKGYPKASCISLNEVVCHGIPSVDTVLKEGDILNIDITTILNGYYGDTSRMFVIGKPDEEAERLIKITKECLDIGINQARAGNRLGNIGYEINKYATSHGFKVVYEFCGHGVGLKFHEEPEVTHVDKKDTGPVLEPGMIFTIEPMINQGKARVKIDKKDGWTARTIDGKLSAQFEHTILITSNGPDVLTDIKGEYNKK